MDEFKYYSFTFTHTNHSVYRGTIKATSDDNLNGQLRSKLFNRFRREQNISKAVVVEITQQEFEALQ